MNTEFRHTRAYGLTSREFARGYRMTTPRHMHLIRLRRAAVYGAIAGLVLVALLAFLYVRGV